MKVLGWLSCIYAQDYDAPDCLYWEPHLAIYLWSSISIWPALRCNNLTNVDGTPLSLAMSEPHMHRAHDHESNILSPVIKQGQKIKDIELENTSENK